MPGPDADWWRKVAADRPGGEAVDEPKPLTDEELAEPNKLCPATCPYCGEPCGLELTADRVHGGAHKPTCRFRPLHAAATASGETTSRDWLRPGDWIDLAAAEIAGDPSVRDGGADRIADVIRGHLERAAKKHGT